MSHEIKNICVYCGSGNGLSPIYKQTAIQVGADIAKNNIGLIYGGGSTGLMGATAQSALNNGGYVTGVIPEFLQDKEIMLEDCSELIVTQNMHERKTLFFEKSDAFIALPGGIGTLEELVEMLTWKQLGQHNKKVLIANINGFWDPLITLIKQMQAETFIRKGMEVEFLVANQPEEVVPLLLGQI
ncbi:MAG: TIGR00730 family Rossman fold protein [Rhizobiales bacterium]|nr:TIGR00730 family Rossman fold protein [Hyphomicrobiales bacterium]